MSDDWDFYFARIDESPAAVFIDLGIRPDVPLEKRPWLLWVYAQLKLPKADGLATNEEAAKLNAIGEALDSLVSATCGAQLVARVTGSGRREFYFYASEPGELAGAAASAMKGFADYKYDFGSIYQPEWEQYLMLFPSDTNLERMQNRRMLESLAQQGDVHELPRKIEHWLYFANESARAACRDALGKLGYAIADESHSDEEGDEQPWQLVVARVDRVDAHSINGITIELARLTREHQGVYDGWDCMATK